jgi:2-polyprenyl-3-methyl-5-hydroxy-6-metoxy-1,4-benzoquinol methylase
MKLFRLARKAVRRTWMNYALRGVGGADNHARLEMAYRLADPWNMESDLERFRFERTNQLVANNFAGTQSLLELGCGEGHQSEYFQRICTEVYGVDVSGTAIGRAQARLPQGRFAAGDIFAQPWGRERGRFDLVVACEVLYYVADIQRTIDEMNFLGKSCFVTIFAPAIRRVGPFIERLPDVRKDWFGAHGAEWVVAFWRSPTHGG